MGSSPPPSSGESRTEDSGSSSPSALGSNPVAVRADQLALLEFGHEFFVRELPSHRLRNTERLPAAYVIEVHAARREHRVAVRARCGLQPLDECRSIGVHPEVATMLVSEQSVLVVRIPFRTRLADVVPVLLSVLRHQSIAAVSTSSLDVALPAQHPAREGFERTATSTLGALLLLYELIRFGGEQGDLTHRPALSPRSDYEFTMLLTYVHMPGAPQMMARCA